MMHEDVEREIPITLHEPVVAAHECDVVAVAADHRAAGRSGQSAVPDLLSTGADRDPLSPPW
jgi:hypothetical protein